MSLSRCTLRCAALRCAAAGDAMALAMALALRCAALHPRP